MIITRLWRGQSLIASSIILNSHRETLPKCKKAIVSTELLCFDALVVSLSLPPIRRAKAVIPSSTRVFSVRYLVFPFDSNPAIDQPAYKLSFARGQELIKNGGAVQLAPGRLQRTKPRDYCLDMRNKSALPQDWITRHVSRLPNGEQLFITTKQLLVGPIPMRNIEA